MTKASQEFLKFVNASPSPFHAVETAIGHLQQAGFTRLYEHQPWLLKPNHSYYFTRNASALIAFRVGGQYSPGNGFLILGAHTDSPCLKVKPISRRERGGYLQVGVETYGGGLWHTWFDRELSLAGRVLVSTPTGVDHKLVNLKAPLLRIPTLAIHLDRTANDGFSFNKEVQLTPVLGQVSKELTGEGKHHAALLDLIGKELNCTPEQIEDFELCLYDTQPAQLGGLQNEFIHSARLDNLMMSFCSLKVC
jgi:aspartyl aminopeptidase